MIAGRHPPGLLQGRSGRRRPVLLPVRAEYAGILLAAGPGQQPAGLGDRDRDDPRRPDRRRPGRTDPRRLERLERRPAEEPGRRHADALRAFRAGREDLRAPAQPDAAHLRPGRRRHDRRRSRGERLRRLARPDRGRRAGRGPSADVGGAIEGRRGDVLGRGARLRAPDRRLRLLRHPGPGRPGRDALPALSRGHRGRRSRYGTCSTPTITPAISAASRSSPGGPTSAR